MSIRILIIDDEKEARQAARRALEGKGYDLHEVGDRSSALARLEEVRPQVILSKIDLPGMEGISLLGEVRKIVDPPLVILITPIACVKMGIEALEAGAHDYIRKPFEWVELVERVRRAIERKKLVEEVESKYQACEVANADLLASQEKIKEYAARLERNLVELRNSQLQLVQAEKMASLGRLVAGVAHEINSPIGAIASNNDLLSRLLPALRDCLGCIPPCPEKQKLMEWVEVLSNTVEVDRIASQRITNIVRNLKNFARLEEAERKPFDIHEGLDSTLRLVHCQFKDRVRVEKDYGDLPPVEGHPNQLNQVFLNVLINAAQAIEGQGLIRITTRRGNGKVVVKIADTGAGIPAEHLDKIFDPGFTTKGVGVGTGLGLSITYKIVQDHGGTIQVESQLGHGTVFTVTLPVR